MFETRVQLLSDYAEYYIDDGKKIIEGKDFWSNLLGAHESEDLAKSLSILSSDEAVYDNLELDGFAKFCKIGDVIIYIRKDEQDCDLVITENGKIWDCSHWGKGYSLRTRFIAECYFMVTKDDFIIDDDEATVMTALIGVLDPTHREILDSRILVYWTLVEKVIEDDIVTNEELEVMAKIREALEISEKNVDILHKKALLSYYKSVKNVENESDIDLFKLDSIKTMASKLGIDPKIFETIQ